MYNVLTLLMTLVSRTKGSNLAGCKGGESGLGNTFGWRRMEVENFNDNVVVTFSYFQVVGSIGSLVFLFSLCFATLSRLCRRSSTTTTWTRCTTRTGS